jgi:succinate dehydrogenase/fumarate reductase flavoprotein subunit
LCTSVDIDISKEPMLIEPTLDFQKGGLEIQPTGENRVPGLFIAGEVAAASTAPTGS